MNSVMNNFERKTTEIVFNKIKSKKLIEPENHIKSMIKNVNHYSGNVENRLNTRSQNSLPKQDPLEWSLKDISSPTKNSMRSELKQFVSPAKKFKNLNLFLSFNGKELTELKFNENTNFEEIQILEAMNNTLQMISLSILKCKSLIVLKLDNNMIKKIPDNLVNIPLEILSLSDNIIEGFPTQSGSWSFSLKSLNLSQNRITSFPMAITEMKNLNTLNLNCNSILELPFSVANISKNLKEFTFEWFKYIPTFSTSCLKSNNLSNLFSNLNELRNSKIVKEVSGISFIELLRNYDSRLKLDHKFAVGRTLLHMAAQNQSVSVIRSILNNSLELVDIKDFDGFTPLGCAIKENKFLSVKALLDYRSNVNAGGGSQISQLFQCLYKKSPCLIKEILKNNCDLTINDRDGNNILHYFSYYFLPDLASKALENGINPNLFNKGNWTPLHFAVKYKSLTYLEWMMDINSKCSHQIFKVNLVGGVNQQTPLSLAFEQNDSKAIVCIIKAGADLYKRDKNHRLPMEFTATSHCDILSAKIYWTCRAKDFRKRFASSVEFLVSNENVNLFNERVEREKKKKISFHNLKTVGNSPNYIKIKEIFGKKEDTYGNISGLSDVDEEKFIMDLLYLPTERLYSRINVNNLRIKKDYSSSSSEFHHLTKGYIKSLEEELECLQNSENDSDFMKSLMKMKLSIFRIREIVRKCKGKSDFERVQIEEESIKECCKLILQKVWHSASAKSNRNTLVKLQILCLMGENNLSISKAVEMDNAMTKFEFLNANSIPKIWDMNYKNRNEYSNSTNTLH